ncbi:alpha/beta-hydrolase [Polyporus arcularius HHB13444]|uniref:Alpha/beta-hydrolase n=1 Tax=Polyporus arcularius HHB13444 TaxID=1314778 RepID=A0A5C3P569_9APHY|nr:alpha/beta-hydrolase [Polyporus arcularius HHB13444]
MSWTARTFTATFHSRTAKVLTFVGKRYTPSPHIQDLNGVTLVFFHCAGSHKEAWEPMIDLLQCQLQELASDRLVSIREAWSFDMPNHGEAASLNGPTLEKGKAGLTVEECSDGFKQFVSDDMLSGHKLVGIGHSLGASALVLSTITTHLAGVVYDSMILVEPAIITRADYGAVDWQYTRCNRTDRERALKAMNTAISKRKDTWDTREEARSFFLQRYPWKTWDVRVLDLFVRHGLRNVELQDSGTASAVKLCCDKDNERRAYRQDEVYFDVVDRLQSLDPAVPVHLIFGQREDVMPKYVYDSILGMRDYASVQRVQNAGHFTLHENPNGLSAAIARILSDTVSPQAKL